MSSKLQFYWQEASCGCSRDDDARIDYTCNSSILRRQLMCPEFQLPGDVCNETNMIIWPAAACYEFRLVEFGETSVIRFDPNLF